MSKVFVLFGIRDGEPYEDPGAEELIGIFASREGAEKERLAWIAQHAPQYQGQLGLSGPYDSVEVRGAEVRP